MAPADRECITSCMLQATPIEVLASSTLIKITNTGHDIDVRDWMEIIHWPNKTGTQALSVKHGGSNNKKQEVYNKSVQTQ